MSTQTGAPQGGAANKKPTFNEKLNHAIRATAPGSAEVIAVSELHTLLKDIERRFELEAPRLKLLHRLRRQLQKVGA